MLGNQFGHFDPTGRVFSITDSRTPIPWVNVICNGRYGLVVSQNGGGFSWLDNSQLNVLTRWEMDLVRDNWGKFLYLADLDAGETWSLAPAPCRAELDFYRCDHTQGATTFVTERRGIRATWTLCVAPDDPVEIWSVELVNRSESARRLRISSYFEWCCGVAPDAKREFHRLFFTTRHDLARRAIVTTKNMWDVPPRNESEHWNRPWPYAAAHAVAGVEFDHELCIADKAMFLGRYGDPASPEAMGAERATTGGFGRFGDAAAAIGGDFALKPGQSVRLRYLLACAPSEREVLSLVDKYSDVGEAARAVEGACRSWQERLAPTQVKTGEPDFDLLNNYWLPYQAISGRIWGRTGYHQQSGAYGFRDQLQDSQVWLPLDPAKTREQILLHAAHQFADGSVYHWWHPLTETGLRTLCSDDYLWLPYVTASYLKETGDFGVLDESAAFVDDPKGATLLEHCRRSLARAAARTSERGLPLIGSCDWNDGLSAVGVGGKGESVWLALFLAGVLGDFAEVYKRVGDSRGAAESLAQRRRLSEALDKHAWDGAWYRCATRDDGRWLGTKENDQGRIYLNPQTWAVLTGATDPKRTEQAWNSVKEQLLGDMGPLLSAPAFTEPDPTIGYITRYAPGLRENGGVYMHAATWALAAACRRKDGATAERIWRSISPPTRCADAEAYRAEPYVTPGNVDGPASATPGKAGWTWYTGSAAWLSRVSLEWVLGIRPTWEGLLIDPCPVPGLGRVDVTRTWRGRGVRVRFDAAAYSAQMPPRLTVNGAALPGGVLSANDYPAGAAIDIEVDWGISTRPVRGVAGRAISGRTAT